MLIKLNVRTLQEFYAIQMHTLHEVHYIKSTQEYVVGCQCGLMLVDVQSTL